MSLPHLKVDPSLLSENVLLPGDPARVDLVGQKLSDFKILGQNREFRVGAGSYKGLRIAVCSTGIGSPSTAIAVEELISAGAKTLLRIGTCGGAWRADIPKGSLIIPVASIRDEGTTAEYIPLGFPAVADFELVSALKSSARQNGNKYYVGINRSHDAFYGSQEAIVKWGNYLSEIRWRNAETPILSSEMESAALFVIASLRGVKAGAIFAVNADPEPLRERLRGESQEVVTEALVGSSQVVDDMISVALDSIVELAGSHLLSL